jgi:hypothetical protein
MTKRQLTELQLAFLSALFGEAKGDPAQAVKLAGYSENVKYSEVVASLKDEIIEQAKMILAMNAPRAAIGLVDVVIDPGQKMASIKMKAAESILDRVGVKSKEQSDVNLNIPAGGLFIMPAKDVDSLKEVKNEKDEEV